MLDFLLSYGKVGAELGRLLGVRFVPGSQANETPIGRSVTRVGQLFNAQRPEEARWELLRVALLVKHLSEIEAEHPSVLKRLAARLLSGDIHKYFGARHEVAIAASLIRKGIAFQYELPEGPDFEVSVEGGTIWIECTSVHIASSIATPNLYVVEPAQAGSKDLSYKLASAIREKGKRPYASRDLLLSIDATNILALSGSEQPSTREAEDALEATGLGAALIFFILFNHDESQPAINVNYQRLDAPAISAVLRRFLDQHFPRGAEYVERDVTPLVP